mgnify:CR=1 FL=1
MDDCPIDMLQEAARKDSGLSSMADSIAILNGGRHSAFRQWAKSEIVDVWEREGYVHWELVRSLGSSDLLDIPLRVLDEPDYDDVGVRDKAVAAFTEAIVSAVGDRPESWVIYETLESEFEGSAREMIAAVREL